MGDIFKYVKNKSAISISVILALISVFAGLVPYGGSGQAVNRTGTEQYYI